MTARDGPSFPKSEHTVPEEVFVAVGQTKPERIVGYVEHVVDEVQSSQS